MHTEVFPCSLHFMLENMFLTPHKSLFIVFFHLLSLQTAVSVCFMNYDHKLHLCI